MKRMRLIATCFFVIPLGVYSQDDGLTLRQLAKRAVEKSHKVQIQEGTTQKARVDKAKAWNAYLPKVGVEASYTYLNAPLEYSGDMQNLLLSTQRLLIKEQAAIQTYGLPSGHASKIDFGTPYTVTATDGTVTNTGLGTLAEQRTKPIPAIQEQSFFKANINAQMLIFSGLKVPYTISAAKHQIAANELLTQAEKGSLILTVMGTYDRLAIVNGSEAVLAQTEMLLQNQKRLIDKSFANGLTVGINQQRIDIALEQLKGKRIELDNARKVLALSIEELTGMSADSAALINPILVPWTLENQGFTSADRPEIKALGEAIAATRYKQKAELSEYVPKVVAFGKKELIKDNLTMLDPEWYVGVGLRWTIFDGLLAKQNAAQTRIDHTILTHKRDEALGMSDVKLQRDWLEVNKCGQLIETAQKQVDLSRSVMRLSQRQFEEGLITLTEHLTSITDLEKAELELIQQIAKQRLASAEYLQTTGQLTIDRLR